ncbi:PDDEXK nuclease domain-containing protein [Arthrobacter sp. Sr33]
MSRLRAADLSGRHNGLISDRHRQLVDVPPSPQAQCGASHFYVGGDDFYVDLLFFHVAQLRYFVVELKTGEFQPEYAGELNFYVALVDGKLKLPAHRETVSILVCGSENEHTVRYALGRADSTPGCLHLHLRIPSNSRERGPPRR